MHFIIHALDKPGALPLRLANYDAHKAYLQTAPFKMVLSGPLLADDHETMIGSLFLVDAETREQVRAFNAADPFAHAGVWASVQIHAFNKRVDKR